MTIDIDAIRQRYDAPHGDECGKNCWLLAHRDAPMLVGEVASLTTQRDEAWGREHVLRTELANTRAQVADLADKLHKANAEIHSLEKATTAYANEVAGLKHELSQADRVIASLRAEIDEYDAAEVA